jgi:lambda family phage portal protein
MANIIDRVIGWVNPHAGLSRHFARQRLARAYEAASPRDSWRPRRAGASANADHQADAVQLRSKSRALVQNVPYIRAGLDALVAATIGTGITQRATGREKDRLNKLFEEWVKVCDADGRLDYYGMQAAAYRAMEQDGEVLIRLRPRRPTDGLPVPLQLQLLEIDWLDSTKTGTQQGNQIVNGIEYDALGAVAAYWLFDQHPGDAVTLRGNRATSRRIPADNIIHLFSPERPGQGRGFPRLAPVIARVRDLQLYEDAELARKNLETRLSVLASGDVSQMANPAAYGESTDNVARARQTGDLGELASGGIIEMPAGANITVVEPKAAPGHVEYVKHQLHIIATGMGVTYEMISGDMRETTFSSARVRLLDFRRTVQQMQWLVVIPKMLDRIHRAFIDAAYLGGMVATRDYAVSYSTPKWDYVNPEQDVKSDLAEIGGGLSSISEKLRQRGYNPDDVYNELKSDLDKLKAMGILDTLLFLQKGNLPTEAATDKKVA